MIEDEIFGALKKCAVGLETNETVEEFAAVDGQLQLVKKKVTRRDIPPDIKAVKLLIDGGGADTLSVEELEEEKRKLLKMLSESEAEEEKI